MGLEGRGAEEGGERVGKRASLLSMPFKPDASSRPRTERAKLSRKTGLDATMGNASADSLPPMDKTTSK